MDEMYTPGDVGARHSIERNIRTLTTFLHKLQTGGSPPSSQDEVPKHLLALAALFNRGRLSDPEARTVVAVTGSSKEDGFQALLVARSLSNNCEAVPFSIGFKEIQSVNGTFEEIMKSRGKIHEPTLEEYIAELVGLFSTYETAADFWDMMAFVIFRCFNKLERRVNADDRFWNVSLVQLLSEWQPTQSDSIKENKCKPIPAWMRSREPFKTAITNGTITDTGRENLILSISNAPAWTRLLADLLSQLKADCSALKGERSIDRRRSLIPPLSNHLEALRKFVGMEFLEPLFNVKSLESSLAIATIVLGPYDAASGKASSARDIEENAVGDDDGINTIEGREHSQADEEAEELQETMARSKDESAAVPVLRHLRSIVSVHSAMHMLFGDRTYRRFFKSLSIGLVEMVGTTRDLAEMKYFKQELSSRDIRERLPKSLDISDDFPKHFTGSIHAEAMLMGLLQHCALDGEFVEHGKVSFSNADGLTRWMAKASMLKTSPIGTGRRCCWCCDALGCLLDTKTQGTHGVIFPWSPPRIGIPLVVLQRLEAELWKRFITAVVQRTTPMASQRTSDLKVVRKDPDWSHLTQEQQQCYAAFLNLA